MFKLFEILSVKLKENKATILSTKALIRLAKSHSNPEYTLAVNIIRSGYGKSQ